MKKARDRFRRRRQVKRQVVAAVARSARSDPRVFADFNLGGRQMRGLLDSGATVSLLGRGCRELAEELNLPVKPYVSTVRTALGEDRSNFGIHFWRIFGIAPDLITLRTTGRRVKPEAWELDESQKVFEEVKATAFEKVGLGKTHAEKQESS
ncbi:hypothetical protein ACLKA7_004910 [Drosophila subpalustris]